MTQRENLSAQGALNLDSNCYNNLLQMVWLQILALKVSVCTVSAQNFPSTEKPSTLIVHV
jgi:hypothetical protein